MTDWKKVLGSAMDLLGTVSPIIATAVKAGIVLEGAYEDFEAARGEIAKLAAQDKVTKAQIDALDDSIQARRKRIHAPE